MFLLQAAQVDENLALQKKKKKKEAAWRVNGDPARDSYAQRRSGYHRFLKEMRQENAQLKMEVQVGCFFYSFLSFREHQRYFGQKY